MKDTVSGAGPLSRSAVTAAPGSRPSPTWSTRKSPASRASPSRPGPLTGPESTTYRAPSGPKAAAAGRCHFMSPNTPLKDWSSPASTGANRGSEKLWSVRWKESAPKRPPAGSYVSHFPAKYSGNLVR